MLGGSVDAAGPGDRLCGTETEYAIRFSPEPGVQHPGNEALYGAIRRAVEALVHTRPGSGLANEISGRIFTENGGSLYYEAVHRAPQGGLVEAGTPECRNAVELVLYQRAQERLLERAVREAEDDLRKRGIRGELSLLKNCRDAFGHVYGTQENYEVDIATGLRLLLWRMSVLAVLPLALGTVLVHWGLVLGVVVALILAVIPIVVICVVLLALDVDVDRLERRLSGLDRAFDLLGEVAIWAATPPSLALGLAIRAFAFRTHRKAATAFFASRCVLSGAGTLLDDGTFALSERALAIRRLSRWSLEPEDRGMLETGHLLKPLLALTFLDWRGFVGLFRRRQRLQLGASDANLCDLADVLKLGTTSLVLDLAEAGWLEQAPALADPIAALHTIARDPTLTARVPLRGGGSASALELQRYYHGRACAWLAETPAVPLHTHELVARWGEVLDALEREDPSLFGRLDWVTKAGLLQASEDLSAEARKKIDLRYHEIGTGYHRWLVEEGLVQRLLDEESIERAIREPPTGTPAAERGRLVRVLAQAGTEARVSWDHVRVGGGLGGQVIPLRPRGTREK